MDNSKQFYPSIDGLRAFCFIAVFLFHVGVPGTSIGWGGVTAFFVISGFLITEILIKSKGSVTYFRSFYIRRALRIFPIYYLLSGVFIFLFFLKNGIDYIICRCSFGYM